MIDDDLISLLETAGVGTANVDIFSTLSAVIPEGDGPYVSLTESGGAGPERIHNKTTGPSAIRPNVQVVARAKDALIARQKATQAYGVLYLRNKIINGTFYREIDPRQEPFDLGRDDVGRARFAFNVTVIRSPS